LREFPSVYGITIPKQILRAFIHAAGLDQLLRGPGGARMISCVDMQYAATVVAENDEYKEDFEVGRWYREEV
jgi:hypothetical protein